jgi:uridine kinase
MKTPYIIGVAGGTGSGKTTLSSEIIKSIPEKLLCYIQHDFYYKDQSDLTMDQRKKTNYDHPDSLETDLMLKHLKQLKSGKKITHPTYDFTKHNRSKTTVTLESKSIIIVEGILIFEDKNLRDFLDMKIYVDTDSDLRLARRLTRDVLERGRTFEQGIKKYLQDVKPMHDQFVEPSKKFADIIVPEGGLNKIATDMIKSQIKEIVGNY